MDREAFREAMREIGAKGGKARAKSLTASQRKRIATKASRGRGEEENGGRQGQETKTTMKMKRQLPQSARGYRLN